MKLLYATGNQSKIMYMRDSIEGLPIEILSPNHLGLTLPQVDESGNDPLENARIKATAFYEAFGIPLFSCDSGLFIDGLPPHRQPGVHVRMVDGRRLDDDEMTAFYSGIAREMGGRCIARYVNAICLISGPGQVIESDGPELWSQDFYLTDTPHPKRRPGFPLDSLSLRLDNGRYFMDDDGLVASRGNKGFYNFFREVLEKEASVL